MKPDQRQPVPNLLRNRTWQSGSKHGFLHDAAASVVTIGSLFLAGCGSQDDTPVVVYAHGVTSGEPLADRVILWTRITTGAGMLEVDWEMATDLNFSVIVARGTTTTDIARDFTVKVDACGLQPATRYWYRFVVGHQRSPVGHTKTLPAGDLASGKLAFLSCANYRTGLLHIRAEAVGRKIVAA